MRFPAILLAVTALAACQKPEPQPEPQPEPVAQRPAKPMPSPPSLPGTPVKDSAAIVGEWRIAGTGDQALSQPYGISATIDSTTIHIVSQCVHMRWTYHLSGGALDTTPIPSSIPPCLRTRTSDEVALESALDAATSARRLDSGALVLSGPGGSAVLFTQ